MGKCGGIRARGLLAGLALGLVPGVVSGFEFGVSPTRAQWKLQGSSIECRLSQPIPWFGEAVFRQGAGEAPQFQLTSTQRLFAGTASLRLEAPPWHAPMAPIQLASVPVQPGRVPVQLGESLADKLMEGLLEGLAPVFDKMPSNARSGHSSVRIAGVDFGKSYGDYRSCLTKLLPVSFADVSRMRIGYASGAFELDDAGRARLDQLLAHLKLREDIKAIFVDGYSDDTGRLKQSIEMSRQRAEAVTAYLVEKGVAAEMITTRYHGARYPVARGRNEAARAQNRRVTVRVERG
jgi:outer membrane protein OmpA-like peptidoglycan-associated protein